MLFTSIIASKTSFKFGIPTLILFLIVGMLAGSDGPGGIFFHDPQLTQFVGMVALTFILFSGGLDTKWESIRPVIRKGLMMSTVGVFVTALSVGVFASFIMDFTLLEGLLLGAIVSSTDAAAVFSILRSKSVGLKGRLRPLLEFESGSNDPMAYFLTISLIFLIQEPEATILSLVPKFVVSMAVGGACGYAFGVMMVWIINRIQLEVEGLYPVLVLSLVFFAFSFTNIIDGNAFLAVYIAGIVVGNSNLIHKKSLMKFYDGQAWLMQIVMFLALGLLVYPSNIVPVIPEGILISVFLILVARPLAVFVSLAWTRDFNIRKKLFVSWVGLRGAAPIVFATYPMVAGLPSADTIFNVVFFISAISVLLQGTTLSFMARLLHVSVPDKVRRRFPLDIEIKDNFSSELVEFDIAADSKAVGKPLVELDLPKSALVVLIHREGRYLTPRGDTVIEPGDHLLVMGDTKSTIEKVNNLFGTAPSLPA